MKKLIIIVPAYCEELSIAETISAIKQIKPAANEVNFNLQIYVINDGSTDNTVAEAKKAGVDRIVNHRVNQGLGSAVRSGLYAAKRDGADIVVKFDADLQHEPEDILEIIKPILNDEAEIVYGNRFEKIKYKMPFIRKAGNIVFTRLMRRMTNWPVVDSQPGIFAVSDDYLQVFNLPGDYNYTQQILLDGYHKGMRFAQVPVSFNKRETGKSFVSLQYPLKVFPQILQVLIGVKPLKVFGPTGLFFLGIGLFVAIVNLTSWLFGDAIKPIQQVNLVLGTGLFGLQTLFFGLLADLIVKNNKHISNN
jgi:glycosyltransferase involved in cell wall biosynthesis